MKFQFANDRDEQVSHPSNGVVRIDICICVTRAIPEEGPNGVAITINPDEANGAAAIEAA